MERIWSDDLRQVIRHKYFTRQQGKRERLFTAKVHFVLNGTVYVPNILDDEGQDLCTFIRRRFQVFEDPKGLQKLLNLMDNSVKCPLDL